MKFILVFCMVAWAHCGKPSLSDNRGLFDTQENLQFSVKDYVTGSIWPKPQEESRGKTLYTLSPDNFKFTKTGEDSDVLTEALTRYKSLTFPDASIPADESMQAINGLNVHVLKPYKDMDLGMDESYSMIVKPPTASLEANTVWGALRGLETFSQLVYQNKSGNYFAADNNIHDFPRFHHRGFLIDTSRHFIAVKFIKQFIDALAYGKYNVLHWHVVDDQSFPFVSVNYPSLHQQGAYNSKTHIYSPEEVKDIIQYAKMRGIRVVPEFDTPGHTQSWFSIKDLLTPCYTSGKFNGNYGPINPIIDKNYDFLKGFFQEVSSVFPDSYLHLGGDEVSFNCWKSNPNITEWMKNKGMSGNYSMLEQYYEQRLLDIIASLGKNYIIWQEVVDNNVKMNTVVNIWKGHGDEWKQEAIDVTKKGYKAILSSPWYLNYISYGPYWPNVKSNTVVNVWEGNWQNEMARVTKKGYRTILSSPWYLNYISYGPDWPNYYKVDPQAFNGTPEQLELVIGGTACMWGEWVDGTNLISRTWARGLAVGERLWSSRNATDANEAGMRMWEHRCRFLRRGIQAENVMQSQYCRHEWMNEK